MLVAMVPLLTIAQKRSKKVKEKTEKVSESNALYEFMVISGFEMPSKEYKQKDGEIASPEMRLKIAMKSNVKVKVRLMFDFGGAKSKDAVALQSESRNYKSMAAAVNGAANYGWEFVNANIVNLGSSKVHYYYMRRSK